MHFADLGTRTQIVEGPHVRAIGWLDADHSFPTGPVDSGVESRLQTFAKAWGESVQALGWGVFAGPHACNLCGTFRASGNFAVPDGELLYVCPEMVAHYVAAHRYAPPEAFVRALMSAPLPGSDEYRAAVARFRGR